MAAQSAVLAEAPELSLSTMKALVYHGPGQKSWESVARPAVLQPTDAIVKIVRTTIC